MTRWFAWWCGMLVFGFFPSPVQATEAVYPPNGWTCEVECLPLLGDESVTCVTELRIDTTGEQNGICPGSYCETTCVHNVSVAPEPLKVVCPCRTIHRATGASVPQSCHLEWTDTGPTAATKCVCSQRP